MQYRPLDIPQEVSDELGPILTHFQLIVLENGKTIAFYQLPQGKGSTPTYKTEFVIKKIFSDFPQLDHIELKRFFQVPQYYDFNVAIKKFIGQLTDIENVKVAGKINTTDEYRSVRDQRNILRDHYQISPSLRGSTAEIKALDAFLEAYEIQHPEIISFLPAGFLGWVIPFDWCVFVNVFPLLMENSMEDIFGPVISRYSRADALEDGVITDVTTLAKEKGFKYPVAISTGVLAKVNGAAGVDGRSYTGVMHDILWILFIKIKRSPGTTNQLNFEVLIYSPEAKRDVVVRMYSVVGPGDDAEPVMTIMLISED